MVPIVLISTREPGKAPAGVRFLRKPFDLDEMLGTIEESLDGSGARLTAMGA